MIVLSVYIGGILLALLLADAPFSSRLALALLWPLGPLAFVVTVSALTIAAMMAFPIFGAIVLGAAAVAWWAWR